MFALVDCNNFYASCERVFRPDLVGKPIAVLSNNDGCIIARSKEVKELGVEMGAPYFKFREICEKNKVHVFSSNYQFYGNMSARVMQTLSHFTPNMEVYSIDEAFLDLSGMANLCELTEYAQNIRQTVGKWTGIPVGVGVGPTKTLAKLANYIAKKATKNGSFAFKHNDELFNSQVLSNIEVKNIWGVGKQHAKKLNDLGIFTVQALRQMDPKYIRANFTVVGERLVYELNGISCIPFEYFQPRKEIMSSKSFGEKTSALKDLEEAVATYASRACDKLRRQQSYTSMILVFVQTSAHKPNFYANYCRHSFPCPTSNTLDIIAAATKCIRKIFKPDYKYRKVGILLQNLTQKTDSYQDDIFAQGTSDKDDKLMKAMDDLNSKYGNLTIHSAAAGFDRKWQMKADLRSPRYTTQWDELPMFK